MSTPVITSAGQSELMTWMTSMNFDLNTPKDDILAALLVDSSDSLLQNPTLLLTPERPGANTVVTASTVRPPSPANNAVVTNNTVVTNTSPDHDETPEQVSASSLYLGVSGFYIFLMLFFPTSRLLCLQNHLQNHLRNHLQNHLRNHPRNHLVVGTAVTNRTA